MDAFFHHPDELRADVAGAGFEIAGSFAIEGIGYMMQDFDASWAVESQREFLRNLYSCTPRHRHYISRNVLFLCPGA
jgi:hypothetical protein